MTEPTLNFGAHAGKPLRDVPADYLFFLTSRGSFRHLRQAALALILGELRRRFADDFDKLAAGLAVPVPLWTTKKARKRLKKVVERQRQAPQPAPAAPPPTPRPEHAQILDAATFVRRARSIEDLL